MFAKKKRKAQLVISFIVGVFLFLSACFAVAIFASRSSPSVTNDLYEQRDDFIFISFVNRVTGNLSRGDYVINETLVYLSDCNLLDMSDAASISMYESVAQTFGIEDYSYNIDISEYPIAATTEVSGTDYIGSFIMEGKEIQVTVSAVGSVYDTVHLTDGINAVANLNEGDDTGNTFSYAFIYVEKIDEEGQLVIFKKQTINCGNYPNKYELFRETKKYLISEDNNLIGIKMSLW